MRNPLSAADSDQADRLAATFVNREYELNELAQELLRYQTRVVLISGGAGMGKTALARMFAHQFGDSFPGGVFSIHAFPVQPLSEKALGTVPDSDEESLLIVDDLEQLSDSVIENELRHITAARPRTRIILTSRREIHSPQVQVTLRLAPFMQSDMVQFLDRLLGYQLGPSAQEELFTRLQGHPLAIALAASALRDELFTVPELLRSLEPFRREGLLGPDGHPLKPESKSYKQIVTDVTSVSDELLRKLAKEPKLLYELSPRLFEEVVAELLARLGYEVTLTPASRDGGKDIYAASQNELGSFLYIVECKRYAPDHPVGVGIIRQLYGVAQAEKATAGILATTSFFTKVAKEFQSQVAFQISLQDYLGIQRWLRSVQ